MNFLAHLYLADNTPYSIIGNLLADFLSGGIDNQYPEEIYRGVILHRRIDRFTDHHAVFRRSKQRLSNEYRLLKGIIIDIFYDHFLAKNWDEYSGASLEDFSEYVYGILSDHQAILPSKLQRILPYMISENWLVSYRDVGEIALVLKRMSRRLSGKNKLAESARELPAHYQLLENDFREFFEDLISYAEKLKGRRSPWQIDRKI